MVIRWLPLPRTKMQVDLHGQTSEHATDVVRDVVRCNTRERPHYRRGTFLVFFITGRSNHRWVGAARLCCWLTPGSGSCRACCIGGGQHTSSNSASLCAHFWSAPRPLPRAPAAASAGRCCTEQCWRS